MKIILISGIFVILGVLLFLFRGQENVNDPSSGAPRLIAPSHSGASGMRKDGVGTASVKEQLPDYKVVMLKFSDYPPKTIVSLLSRNSSLARDEKAEFMFKYNEYLKGFDEFELLLEHLKAIAKGDVDITMFSYVGDIASELECVGMNELVDIDRVFEGNSEARRCLGIGVRKKLSSVGQLEECLELCEDYLKVDFSLEVKTEIYGIVATAIANQSPEKILSRMMEIPDEYSKEADRNVIRSLAKDDTESAMLYMQKLFDDEKFERGNRAIDSFIAFNLMRDPEGAFRWSVTLPEEAGKSRASAISTSFHELRTKAPEKARSIYEEIDDPEIKAILDTASKN